jgi:flavodoxin
MNVGLIVYSHSGNTLSVAQRLETAMANAGHTVTIERVEPVNDDPNSNAPVQLKSAPDVRPYDAVVFASPVHAFSLPRVMKLYLSQLPDMTGKRVSCFVTQQLKWSWLGGSNTVRQIQAASRAKGAKITSSGIIHWSSPRRQDEIDDLVSSMVSRLNAS